MGRRLIGIELEQQWLDKTIDRISPLISQRTLGLEVA